MDPKLEGVGAGALERIQEQARIQVQSEDRREVLWELLPLDRDADGNPVPDRGLLGLPEPSPGDLFLDLEGDPFALDDGIDYLFGILEPRTPETDPRWAAPDGQPVPAFHAFWGIDDDGQVTWAAEKAAFERTIDLIIERLDRDPALHVYHYAAVRADGPRAARAAPRDARGGGRPAAARQACSSTCSRRSGRASSPASRATRSSGIEPLYALQREVALKDAGSSIVAFETWLELGAESPVEDGEHILAEIAGYNRDDVVSNWRLRDWLEDRRRDLEAREGVVLPRPEISDGSASAELTEREQEVAAVSEVLTAGVPDDPVDRASRPEGAARWLLAQMLTWHRREDKSAWWRYFALMGMTDDELIERTRAPGRARAAATASRSRSRSPTRSRSRPRTTGSARTRRSTTRGRATAPAPSRPSTTWPQTITIKRGPILAGVALPRSIVPQGVVPSGELAESLLRDGTPRRRGRVGRRWCDDWRRGRCPHRSATCSCARRRTSDRVRARRSGDPTRRRSMPRHGSCRAMPRRGPADPGPPGFGKTYTGARMIVDLVAEGKRVGVVANSHKVIGKVLDEVAKAAIELDRRRPHRPEAQGRPGPDRTRPRSCSRATRTSRRRSGRARSTSSAPWPGPGAGAEFARPEPALDVLVVDEAGQMSLANVLACAPSARTIVLLGDPQQLDQPTQGVASAGADRSALSHLLADPAYLRPDRATIRPEEGLFLDTTWRLHPEICDFTSRAFYAGRLRPRDGLEAQAVIAPRSAGPLSGTGLRYLPVPHAGNDTDSAEEARTIAELVAVAARDAADAGSTATAARPRSRSTTS